MTTPYCTVLSTYNDDANGKEIIAALLEKQLAACVQVMPVESHYLWKGGICCDSEKLMIIKTTAALWKEVEQCIVSLHAYEVPQIVQLPIADGLQAYLEWIKQSTK